MEDYAVRIKRRHDGLVVARIPSLSRAVGYGLDRDEAVYELFKRILLRKGSASPSPEQHKTAPTLATC